MYSSEDDEKSRFHNESTVKNCQLFSPHSFEIFPRNSTKKFWLQLKFEYSLVGLVHLLIGARKKKPRQNRRSPKESTLLVWIIWWEKYQKTWFELFFEALYFYWSFVSHFSEKKLGYWRVICAYRKAPRVLFLVPVEYLLVRVLPENYRKDPF